MHTRWAPQHLWCHYPVGRWQLTDFGISEIRDLRPGRSRRIGEYGDFQPEETTLGPKDQRLFDYYDCTPGPFHAPEASESDYIAANPRADVWSLGCILAIMLAFTIGGPAGAEAQHRCRVGDGSDSFFRRRSEDVLNTSTMPFGDVVFSYGQETVEIKPAILQWVRDAPNLTYEVHLPWIRQWCDLILRLLHVDSKRRPDMRGVIHDLEKLTTETQGEYLTRYCLGDLDGVSIPPEADGIHLETVRQTKNLLATKEDQFLS